MTRSVLRTIVYASKVSTAEAGVECYRGGVRVGAWESNQP